VEKNPILVDCNCRFDLEYGYNYDTADTLLTRAKKWNVSVIINIVNHLRLFHGAISLAERFPEIYIALGFSPTITYDWSYEHLDRLQYYLYRPKVVAVGEIGLDYSTEVSADEKRSQHTLFRKQLEMAISLDLPIIVSCINAYADLLSILHSTNWSKQRGLVCNFTGSEPEARELIASGFYISYSGRLTRSAPLQKTAKSIPLDKVLFESGYPLKNPPYPQKVKYNVRFSLNPAILLRIHPIRKR